MRTVILCLALGLFLGAPLFSQETFDPARKAAYAARQDAGAKICFQKSILKVCESNSNGMFTEGICCGSRAGETLLYGFPSEGSTSHANFIIDGTVHNQASGLTVSTPLFMQNDSSSVIGYTVGDITIRQILTIVDTPDALETVLIQFEMVNNSTERTHSVGVLLEMDTQIAGNDAAPLSTVFGYSAREYDWYIPEIPSFWQAFEESPTQPPGLLIGRGDLVGGDAVMPDRFAVGRWGSFTGVDWTYAADTTALYGDSAVLLWWGERPLYPGETWQVGTYYGLGLGIVAAGTLSLNLSYSNRVSWRDCQLTPNPIDINLFVYNTGRTMADSVHTHIRMDAGLTLEAGYHADTSLIPWRLNPGSVGRNSWQVVVPEFDHDTSLCFTISATSTTVDSNFIRRCIDIQGVDHTAPVLSPRVPQPGQVTSIASQPITINAVDPDGLLPNSAVVHINGLRYAAPHPFITVAGDSLRFTPGSPFTHGTLVGVVVDTLQDFFCNPASLAEYTFRVDLMPPDPTNPIPAPFSIEGSRQPVISVDLTDEYTAVNTATLILEVQDSTYTIDGSIVTWAAPTLTFHTALTGRAFRGGDTVHVSILRVGDTPDLGTPNYRRNWSWVFYIASVTNFTLLEPLDATITACADQNLRFLLQDDTGIDWTTLHLGIDGTDYAWGNPGLSHSGDTVRFDPTAAGTSWVHATSYNVTVNASNTFGNPMTAATFSFTADLQPPQITWQAPLNGHFLYNDNEAIRFRLEDIPTGIDTALLSLTIDGVTHRPGELGITFDGTELLVNPVVGGWTWPAEQGVTLCLNLEDHPDYCPPNRQTPCFTWPCAILANPTPEDTSSCKRQVMTFRLRGWQTLDPAALQLRVNGVDHPQGDGTWTVRDSTLTFTPPADLPDGLVSISLVDSLGTPGNRMNWAYTADVTNPTVEFIDPINGVTVTDLNPIIHARMTDNRVLDLTTTVFRLGDHYLHVGDNGVDYNPGTGDLTIDPRAAGITMIEGTMIEYSIDAYDRVNPAYCPANNTYVFWSFYLAATPCMADPNPVTPNADGKNDLIRFKFTNMRQKAEFAILRVYDKRNQLVRELGPAALRDEVDAWVWDGRDGAGKVVPPGLYIYTIAVEGKNTCSGVVTVVW